jgi:hypothetical protein
MPSQGSPLVSVARGQRPAGLTNPPARRFGEMMQQDPRIIHLSVGDRAYAMGIRIGFGRSVLSVRIAAAFGFTESSQ